MLPAPAGLWAMPKEMLETIPGYGPDIERQPRGGAQADAEGGLWPGQASRGQGLDPQHSGLPRSRRDPDRPAQEHLYRRRARRGRHRATGSRRSRARTTRSASTSPATRSTIPTSRSTRTIPAARSATTPTTATRTSRSCSTSNRQETDVAKRKKLVWEIDKKLQEDVARPIIFHGRTGHVLAALCQGRHHHGEQLLQRLSLRGRVDGQVASGQQSPSRLNLRDSIADRYPAAEYAPTGAARCLLISCGASS